MLGQWRFIIWLEKLTKHISSWPLTFIRTMKVLSEAGHEMVEQEGRRRKPWAWWMNWLKPDLVGFQRSRSSSCRSSCCSFRTGSFFFLMEAWWNIGVRSSKSWTRMKNVNNNKKKTLGFYSPREKTGLHTHCTSTFLKIHLRTRWERDKLSLIGVIALKTS